jgi:hypothetical protein
MSEAKFTNEEDRGEAGPTKFRAKRRLRPREDEERSLAEGLSEAKFTNEEDRGEAGPTKFGVLEKLGFA